METRVDNKYEYNAAILKINSFLKRGLDVNTVKVVSDVEIYLEISMLPEFKAELIRVLDEALVRYFKSFESEYEKGF